MRTWEIREGYSPKHYEGYRKSYGMRDSHKDEAEEAYDCGYEDGYRDAMKEAKAYYSEKMR